MKHIKWIGFFVVGLAAIFAIVAAIRTGEKSPFYVSGTIVLPAQFQNDAFGIRTLFVTVFDEESSIPMPYGAMKESLPLDLSQPISFALTKEKMQIMNPDGAKPRYMRVKVRFDKDGFGGADQPGDIVGEVEHVPFGASEVAVTMQKKVQ